MSTLPASYRFTSRSDYKRKGSYAIAAALRVAGDNLTSEQQAAIRASARAAFEAKHGPLSAIKPFPSATSARASAPAPRLIPAPAQARPLTPTPALVPTPPLGGYAAEPTPAEPDSYDAPRGARVVVQCYKGCGRWFKARPGRPVAKDCGQHRKHKPRRDESTAALNAMMTEARKLAAA